MLPVGQKRQNDSLDQDAVDSDDSVQKPAKRNGRRKIKIEYIEDKNRRHITFSKRKAGIMKKAYELSTLTGTQVLLLVVSETGLVYTFTTTKLQPIVTKPEGKNLIQACLNTPDPSMPEMNAENKLDDDTSQNQLSPQTASSQSPMMQPAPNAMRQNMVAPPMSTTAPLSNVTNPQQQTSGGPVNYSQSNQPHHHQPPPPQMGSMAQYNQQRYPPHSGYTGSSLPQPNQPYPHPHPQHNQQVQSQYGGNQPSYYQQAPQHPPQQASQQQNAPSGPPPLGYWSYNDQQQGNAGNSSAATAAANASSQQQQQQARQTTLKPERP
ncbi:transcription factor of the MADS box [Mucor circinelloides]